MLGSILLLQGEYFHSRLIALGTKEPGQKDMFSHCEIVVAETPHMIFTLGAVPPKARVTSLTRSLTHSQTAVWLHPFGLTDDQRQLVVDTAMLLEGKPYGIGSYPALIGAAIFASDWIEEHFQRKNDTYFCSELICEAYQAVDITFGAQHANCTTPNEVWIAHRTQLDMFRAEWIK